jgi:Sulfatase
MKIESWALVGERIRAHLRDLRWNRALAQILVLLAFSMWTCIAAHGLGYHIFWIDLLFCLHTTTWVLFSGFLTIFPKRSGTVLWCLSLLATSLAGVWMIASVELYIVQGRPLLWSEILYRFTDPASRDFAFSVVLEPRLWLVISGGLIGGSACAWLLKHIPRQQCGYIWLMCVFVVKVLATGWVLLHPDALSADGYHGMRSVYAPWHPVHYETQIFGVCIADSKAAKAVRQDRLSPLFAAGADPLWSRFGNAYPGRSVIVISLESHRLSNIAPFGEGAFGFQDLSPHLSMWRSHGISFTNAIQVGQHTQTMAWSLVTGLPNHPDFDPSMYTPQLSEMGPLREFSQAGYVTSWLQATNTSFAGQDQVLIHAGAECRLETEESSLPSESANSWGMGDRELFKVASGRITKWNELRKPYVLVIATVSNHPPFVLPSQIEGVPLTRDNFGGMRYADDALDRFLAYCWSLPAELRPLVYITADHTFRTDLAGAEPAGMNGPEGFRIPGLLLLPDEAGAGTTWDGLICHQDELDLLAHLTADRDRMGTWKFRTHHRIAVGMVRGSACSVITRDGFFEAESQRAWRMGAPWSLKAAEPTQLADLRELSTRVRSEIEGLWPVAAGTRF